MPAMRIFVSMRSVLPILLALAAISPALAAADDSAPADRQDQATSPRQHLDTLFTALKRERDPEQANIIADEIREIWNDSGSATINLLMQWTDKAILEKRNAAALDFLDQAIALKPDYAEAWNRRATLNYALGNYRKSMEDINQVLRLEPRHFGALAGMAAILDENGNDELALKAWQRFLEIYPSDRNAQQQVDTLTNKLAGNPI